MKMNKQELASRIWESANAIRSKIEANEYKDYILGFIFYKFLSEKQEQFLLASGMTTEEFPELLVEDDLDTVRYVQDNVGYFIAYTNLYSTWLKRGNDFNVGDVRDALNAFTRLISENDKALFKGIFDTLQTGLSKLGDSATSQTKAIRELLKLIKDIPMDEHAGYDVLGFIYEYLIEKFAANAGKKAGEFYTPHEVSLLMSHIIAHELRGRTEIQIYDPTSGSGSLLLNIGQAVARHMGDPDRIKYYAQELKANTYNLTRMNLVMRGIKPDNIAARNADTLEQDWPMFDEDDPVGTYKPLYVDAVVSNPPYSQHWDPTDKEADPRYARFGLAPASKADYAFLLHDLFHLKPNGVMTIVLPHGVLFRGGLEETIRQNLIEQNHIDTIIGLPANIFFGTGIPTIIMVLKQRRDRDDVLFIDASQGFVKVGKNNQLRASDIQRIAHTVEHRQDVERFARVVSRKEIRANDYNLNLPRYVSATPPAEPIDLRATVFGGIPETEIDELSTFWNVIPGLRETLFTQTDKGYAQLNDSDLHTIIDQHPAVGAFRGQVTSVLEGLDDDLVTRLVKHRATVPIMATEEALTADIFTRFAHAPLVDSFDAYQVLHDQWVGIANDLEMIQTEGDTAIRAVDPVMVIKKKQKSKEVVEEQDGWEGRIIPFRLAQEHLLPELLAETDDLATKLSSVDEELAGMFEGFSEEDLLDLADVLNAAGDAFAKTALNKAVRDLNKTGEQYAENSIEATQLRAKKLLDDRTKLARQLKTARVKLEDETHQAINNLTDTPAEELLIAKWVTPLIDELATMPETVLRRLDQQLEAIRTKYANNLIELDTQIRSSENRLTEMLGRLTGTDADIQGIKALQELLGGTHD